MTPWGSVVNLSGQSELGDGDKLPWGSDGRCLDWCDNTVSTLTPSSDESVDTDPRRRAPRGEHDDRAQCVEATDAGRTRHDVREQERQTGNRGHASEEAEHKSESDREFTESDNDGDPTGVGYHEAVEETAPPAVRGVPVTSESGDTGAVVVEERRVLGAPYLGHASFDPHDPHPDAHCEPRDGGDLGLAQPPDKSGGGAFSRVTEYSDDLVHNYPSFVIFFSHGPEIVRSSQVRGPH